jgi:hypothetical protein
LLIAVFVALFVWEMAGVKVFKKRNHDYPELLRVVSGLQIGTPECEALASKNRIPKLGLGN